MTFNGSGQYFYNAANYYNYAVSEENTDEEFKTVMQTMYCYSMLAADNPIATD